MYCRKAIIYTKAPLLISQALSLGSSVSQQKLEKDADPLQLQHRVGKVLRFSHIWHIRIAMSLFVDLIRFPPAETAIIFLSLGFSWAPWHLKS